MRLWIYALVLSLILDVQVRNPGHELLTPLAFWKPVRQSSQPLKLSLNLLLGLEALLAGKPPLGEQRPSLGCNIKWK